MDNRERSFIDNPVIAHSVALWLPVTENWIHNQIKWQRKYRNIILADRITDPCPDAEDLFVSERLPLLPRMVNRAVRRLTGRDLFKDNLLARYGRVLLHSHFGPVGWSDMQLKNKTWHITRFYGYDIDNLPQTEPRWQERFKALFGSCDAFLVEGPFMRESLARRGCPREKIFVHPLGTDVDMLPFMQRQYNGRLRLLIASRFTEKKGVIYALEGVAKAYHELDCRELSVTIVGDSVGAVQEQYKAAMLHTVARNKIGHIVTMVGMKSYGELIKLALEHNIFLHPSVTASNGDCEGGYPVVLLDMMATGLPVISTRHCDIPQVVTDDRYGILCTERSGDEIAKAIFDVARGTVKFDSAVVARHIRDNFNWERSGHELVAIYEKVIAGR